MYIRIKSFFGIILKIKKTVNFSVFICLNKTKNQESDLIFLFYVQKQKTDNYKWAE